MLGLAIGDVLGCPVEGMSFGDIRRRYGAVEGLIIPNHWKRWRLPGLHSDDTQQALAVLEVMSAGRRDGDGSGGRDADAVAHRLAELYVDGSALNRDRSSGTPSFGCWRGTGRGFRQVVDLLQANRDTRLWPHGCAQPSAGLGALMRIPPVGLLETDLGSILRLVSSVTRITHGDPLATASACGVAIACKLLKEQSVDSFVPARFLRQLASEVRWAEERIFSHEHDGAGPQVTSQLVSEVEPLIAADPGAAMRAIGRATHRLIGRRLHPTAGFAPSGLAASLYFFVHDPASPDEAILTAVNAGEDTDTIGAITGAFCGALNGLEPLRRFLPDVVALDFIARSVDAAARADPSDEDTLLSEESFLTGIEDATSALLSRYQQYPGT